MTKKKRYCNRGTFAWEVCRRGRGVVASECAVSSLGFLVSVFCFLFSVFCFLFSGFWFQVSSVWLIVSGFWFLVQNLGFRVNALLKLGLLRAYASEQSWHTHISNVRDSGLVGEVPRGEKMVYSGSDPASYITEYTFVYKDKRSHPL